VNELAPGVWYWHARHPEWTKEDDVAGHSWGPQVTSYAFALDGRVVLVDPVIPPDGLDELIQDREAAAVLTCPWHARDALKLSLPVYAPASEQEGIDSAISYTVGDRLPLGIEALPGLEPEDLVLWIESHRALVFGDTLVDLGSGLELPDDWGPRGISHSEVRAQLRRCLELPFELALPSHGKPAGRDDFQHAVRD
jgi:glyoxylase-like metal-dependent hydrolase (beta-lactamase superfamily II)